MSRYYAKWASAGLIIPLLVLASLQLASIPDDLILGLWPSSILLMALDTSPPAEIWYVVYVWSVAVAINIILYLLLGLFFRLVVAIKRRTDEENS